MALAVSGVDSKYDAQLLKLWMCARPAGEQRGCHVGGASPVQAAIQPWLPASRYRLQKHTNECLYTTWQGMDAESLGTIRTLASSDCELPSHLDPSRAHMDLGYRRHPAGHRPVSCDEDIRAFKGHYVHLVPQVLS